MSTVQFNLLPDVKLEFNRSEKLKKLVYTIAFLATTITVSLAIICFFVVNVVQKQQLSNADDKLEESSQRLKSIADLDKILTIQNQLGALPSLHQSKHITSRLFTYLPQITPPGINMGKLNLDTTTSTIKFSGTADSIRTVDQFVDTLKFATFMAIGAGDVKTGAQNYCQGKSGTTLTACLSGFVGAINGGLIEDQACKSFSDEDKPACIEAFNANQSAAFPTVILSTIGRNDEKATYIIDVTYDPALFNAQETVALHVPKQFTTRSITENPNDLFNGQVGEEEDNKESQQPQGQEAQ